MRSMLLALLITLALACVLPGAALAAVPQFTERAQAAGLANPGFTFCLAADDFDGDGDVDVFEGNVVEPGWLSPHLPRLYANDGAGNFTLVTDSAFADCAGSQWFDMDADGDLDAVTFRDAGTPLVCYENLGGLQFADVTAQVGLAGINAVNADVCDFDGDSWLDLIVARQAGSEATIEVWCRRGAGFVRERVFPTPTTTPTTSIDAVTAVDWDRDGDPDLLVHDYGAYWNYDPRTYALENRPGEATSFAVFPVPEFPATWSPFTWSDVDLDGDWDFFAGASDYHGGQNHLVLQQGPGAWGDIGGSSGLWAPWLYTSNAAWGDLDLDGYPDLFQPRFAAFAGYTTSRLFRSNGDLTFGDTSAALGATVAQYSNGNAWFDADADGDLDLLVARGGDHNTSYGLDLTTEMFFRNDTAGAGHWLQIDLVGAGGNRHGRGAEVAVHAGGRLLLATPCGGSAPGRAQNPHRITVGLAESAMADSVVVRWRNGRVTRLLAVPADQRVAIAELPTLAFADVTESHPGLEDEGGGNSVAWIDFDADGDLDLSVGAGANRTNRLFLSGLAGSGAVSFSPFTDPLVANPATTRGLAWGAFAGADRCPDLYQGAPYAANVLVENACGAVADRTDEVTAGPDTPTNGARVVDFDRDGRLDLHELRPEAPDRLLRNLGDWRFAEMLPSALSLVEGSFDAAWADADGDGDQDVYVTREAPWPNVLLRNDGNGVFTDATPALLATTERSQGASWGDYDNDGDLDLFVTNWLAGCRLFRNEGGLSFTDATGAGLGAPVRGQSGLWGDLDNDGWLDLCVTAQGDPLRLWLNVSDGAGARTFLDATDPALADLGPATGAALADYDQDGDLDLYVGAHLGRNALLRNELAPGRHWLQVDLVATRSNPSAVGARLTLVAGDLTMCREVGAAGGMWSQDPLRLHFGLGDHGGAQLTVRWPSGLVSRVAVTSVDRLVTVTEPESISPLEWPVVFADDFEDGLDPAWIQPQGGWSVVGGRLGNLTTCGFQSCIPDIWAGGPDYADYLLTFDLQLASGNLYAYVMADLPAEHEQGQTGAYALDAGIGDGPCGGYLSLVQPWPAYERLTTRQDPAFCFDPAVTYRVRIGRVGAEVLYKAWPRDQVEPEDWLLRATDDRRRAGYFGFGFWNGLGWIDNVVVRAPLGRARLADVPGDQGGQLRVAWDRCAEDAPAATTPVTGYVVQRFAGGWQDVGNVAAAAADSYATVIATPDIVTAGQAPPWSRYRVVALTADPLRSYVSPVDSAYTVDDLAPPKPLARLVEGLDYRYLVWEDPQVPDLASACVFRGEETGFTPAEPVACPEEFYAETHLRWYFYRVRFKDSHGNVSEFSDELHGQWPTGVGEAPVALRLYPCQPNPFNPRTTVRFDLPAAAAVRLTVFDLAGRAVRVLVDDALPAGSHEAAWDGRDGAGRETGSGTYLARLEAGGKVEVTRMVLLR